MKSTDAAKVKHPHPLMQQGTPPQDVERLHIGFFTVFRLGGGGPPKHVETINNPEQFLEPSAINALVGGGDYVVKACANGQTSGRQHGSVLATTNFAWDGPPNIRTAPATAFHAQPQSANAPPPQSFFEQAASQGPAIVGALTAGLGGIMQIINSGREAREREEARRREYDESRRREEREDRDRKEALMRQEAEERRERERQREEERRERDRQDAEERRAERERIEQARLAAEQKREDERLQMMRFESERRAATEQLMLKTLLESRSGNGGLDSNLLLNHLLNRPAAPVQAAPSIDQILGAAQKLKEFGDSGDKEMIGMIISSLAPTPVGQEIIARAGSLVGLYPKPEPPPPPVVTQPAVVPPQMPEQASPLEPSPAAPIEPGPVTLN